jgi:biopolymer transport protein ExbD
MQANERKDDEPSADINTTPLIDVMLVLLVMLIVTLPPQRNAVKIDSPRENNDPMVREEPDVVRILVDFDGVVSWNGEAVTHDEWERRMAAEARRDPQPEIHVEPHKLAKYGYVASVMASAQREGLTKLGVIGGT